MCKNYDKTDKTSTKLHPSLSLKCIKSALHGSIWLVAASTAAKPDLPNLQKIKTILTQLKLT